MLLAIMYHRIGLGKYTNSLSLFREHFQWMIKRYPIVLPGDPLDKKRLSVCLTFDDATCDFYHFIFPLLKELQLRVLLGVPAKYIVDHSTLSIEERLSIPHSLAMQEGFFDQKHSFCTWEELREMVSSGLVEVASHSWAHCNLLFPFVDLQREVVQSKEIIELQLPQAVSSFIYPFGKVNRVLHEYVSNHYPYSFRIGSALNWGWGEGKKPITRLVGDNMLTSTSLFSSKNIIKSFFKLLTMN